MRRRNQVICDRSMSQISMMSLLLSMRFDLYVYLNPQGITSLRNFLQFVAIWYLEIYEIRE